MAKRTLAAAEREIANLEMKVETMESQRTELREAIVDLLSGVFVSKDEAEEIARDAVSERIW